MRKNSMVFCVCVSCHTYKHLPTFVLVFVDALVLVCATLV